MTYTNRKPAYYLNRQFIVVCSEMNGRFVSNEYIQKVKEKKRFFGRNIQLRLALFQITVVHPVLPEDDNDGKDSGPSSFGQVCIAI